MDTYLLWVISTDVIINFTFTALYDTTWTFPCAFTSLNYVIPTIYWIDGISGIEATKTITNVTLMGVIRASFNTTGELAFGF